MSAEKTRSAKPPGASQLRQIISDLTDRVILIEPAGGVLWAFIADHQDFSSDSNYCARSNNPPDR